MLDRNQCLEKARQAEELAAVVAYEKDKERLRSEAANWRAQADGLRDVQPPNPTAARR